MKILLTGADGFLGSHILRRLLEKGHEVRAFLQASRNQATIQGLSYEPFYGDLLNEKNIEDAIMGCDALIHTVAITDVWPDKNPLVWEINYEVLRNIVRLVKKHGIKRFIYIGTANSFGFGPMDSPGTEQSPYNGAKFGLDYMDSKKAAQDYLLQEYRDNKLPVIIINPSFMLGEYDTKPGSGAMVLGIVNKKIPICSRGGKCFTYVNDVAVAVTNSLKVGMPGECYITGGTNMSYREFFRLVGDVAGVAPPKRSLPTALLLLFAFILEAGSKVTKKAPLFSRTMARISTEKCFYSSAKAIKELGMPQTDIRTAVERTITWFCENGYCRLEEK